MTILSKKLSRILLCVFLALPMCAFGQTASVQNTFTSPQEQLAALTQELKRIGYQNDPALIRPLSSQEIDTILDAGITWLSNAQEDTGHFKYEYVPYENRYLADDNIVRQTGALYILGEISKKDTQHVYDLQNTMIRTAKYFERLSEKGSFNNQTFRCIVDGGGSHSCKLGATSLALIGMLDFVETYPQYQSTYRSLITDYANFILAMKKKDAGFRNVFNTNLMSGPDTESSFSNGEALLALVRYYQFKPDTTLKGVIDDVFEYIRTDVPFDTALYLWATAAVKDMDMLWHNDEYFAYIKSYTDWRVEGFSNFRSTTHNMCAYIEGVVSAYPVLASRLNHDELQKYRDEIDFWLSKNSQLQITAKDTVRLRNTREISFTQLENPHQALGGFLTGSDELTQRVDFTQHCLSSYAQKLIDIDNLSFMTK